MDKSREENEVNSILFVADKDDGWIGGLYYIKNMLFALTKSIYFKQLKIYVYVSEKNQKVFSKLANNENIELIIYKSDKRIENFYKKLLSVSVNFLFGKSYNKALNKVVKNYSVKTVFPEIPPLLGGFDTISWIPDFQHIHLPKLFSRQRLLYRNRNFLSIAKNHQKLVLSSKDAFNDYKNTYPKYLKNVYVIPFVSAIDEEMIYADAAQEVKSKLKVPKKYFFVANQFWMHKDHLTLFKAVNEIVNSLGVDIHVVCCGSTNDYRNKNYYGELVAYREQNKLEKNIQILGFIDRFDQIQLMKSSICVIQPSLFEGWGTVVEDAKTLEKDIILSDIKVHFEQMNDQCTFFKRGDSLSLAKAMLEYWHNDMVDNVSFGCNTSKAKEYGENFYEMVFR